MAQLNEAQLRAGVAWATNTQPDSAPPDVSPWEWFWQAIQGDFNENRTTSQILTDAGLSMIPGVDQICDLRDLVANCKKLHEDLTDGWAWVSLGLTLIGLIPSLGSLVKGVLKIVFLYVRRRGGDDVALAVEESMSMVITFLRRRDVQKYLGGLQIDEVFTWLSQQVTALGERVDVKSLLASFDTAIKVMEVLMNKVAYLPKVGPIAKSALEQVRHIRAVADAPLQRGLAPLLDTLKKISLEMEKKVFLQGNAILDASHVHFRGTLPEATAETMMRTVRPRPKWLTEGNNLSFDQLKPASQRPMVETAVKDGWPPLTDINIASFHSMLAITIRGPARLYRIVSPNSRAMSDCWVSEEVFNKLKNSRNPREAWRKNLAVWPDWNANGQFVIYDIEPGETLKVWRGAAASQTKTGVPDSHLAGGWEQIIFKIDRTSPANDTLRYYQLGGKERDTLQGAITQQQFDALPAGRKGEYVSIREQINHPNITGPFETGWGYTDFAGENFPTRIGLPTLHGQLTN